MFGAKRLHCLREFYLESFHKFLGGKRPHEQSLSCSLHSRLSAVQTTNQRQFEVNDSQFPPEAKRSQPHTISLAHTPEALLRALIRTTNDVSQRVGDELKNHSLSSLSESNKVKKWSCRNVEWEHMWGGRDNVIVCVFVWCQVDECCSRSHCGGGGVGGHQITAVQGLSCLTP